jgi:hypothetical protein
MQLSRCVGGKQQQQTATGIASAEAEAAALVAAIDRVRAREIKRKIGIEAVGIAGAAGGAAEAAVGAAAEAAACMGPAEAADQTVAGQTGDRTAGMTAGMIGIESGNVGGMTGIGIISTGIEIGTGEKGGTEGMARAAAGVAGSSSSSSQQLLGSLQPTRLLLTSLLQISPQLQARQQQQQANLQQQELASLPHPLQLLRQQGVRLTLVLQQVLVPAAAFPHHPLCPLQLL